MPHKQVSTMHSINTFTVSRERQKPASSMVKPTCMPNTRNAAPSVQVELIGLTTSSALAIGDLNGSGGVAAGVVAAAGAAASAGLASCAWAVPQIIFGASRMNV